MISTSNGVIVQDTTGQHHYLSDYRKGGTAVQWAEDALKNLPDGPVWFWAGGKAVLIDRSESYWDLYSRWWTRGKKLSIELHTGSTDNNSYQ